MRKNSIIYVAGHTGLIGQALIRELKREGYRHLIFKTHRELDLTDTKKTEAFLKKQRPEYIFLAAGKVGGIKANSEYPADFIYENIMIESNLIHLAYRYKVNKLFFLGCGCVYPRLCAQPIKEEYLLTGPLEPTNEPYALAKIAGLKMCQAYNKQYGSNFISSIAANAYGPYDHFDDDGHVVPSLIKRFHSAKTSKKKQVVIWGSGKPRRDFIYADDIARACVFLMKNYNNPDIINIGSGRGGSIAELAGVIREAVGFKGEILFDRSKPDGMPEKVLDITKLTSLGWRAMTELREGIRLTYDWYKTRATITPS